MTHHIERILAYVDGELDEAARVEFERAMAADPALAGEVEAHRALRSRITGHFAPVAEEPVPDRLRALFPPEEAAVIDLAEARERRDRRRWLPGWANAGAMAASLAVGVVGAQMIGQPALVASREGGLYAGSKLEKALDTELASAQPPDARIRIGLSFRDHRGVYCRTFANASIEGIACRDGSDWRLRQTIAPENAQAQTDYRQASSSALAAAAEAMMAGDPLDAEVERAARDEGWR